MRVVGKMRRERRRDKRLGMRPITIDLGEKTYTTRDWGLGGFRVEPYAGNLERGDFLRVRVIVDDGKRRFTHVVDTRVVRVDYRRLELAANFIELDADAFETLEGWLSGRLEREARKAVV